VLIDFAEDKPLAESSIDRQEFILLHLTSLVREGLFDKLSAFVEAALPQHTPAARTAPKQIRLAAWGFTDPKLEKIWKRMVERLTDEAVRAAYDFDPARLVAPSGTLDAPIMFGLHWPPLTDTLRKYSTIGDTMFNPCIKWLAKKFGGLDDALAFDFRPLALRKPEDYSDRPPWHDMPSGMLVIIDETLQEIMEASAAKVAVYFGKHCYEMYRKLYPNSEPVKLSNVPMYGRKFTHACVEHFESGPNTDEIRRVVFFCYHPGSYLFIRFIVDHSY
jgi:hypothetical protein